MQILVFYGVILWVITEVLLHNERREMDTVADIILILSVIGLIVSLAKPSTFHKFGKGKLTKKGLALRFGAGIVVGLILLAVFAPSTSPKTKSSTITTPTKQTANKQPTSSTPKAATATPKTTPVPSQPSIIGYGATQSDWDSNHQRDSRYEGLVYNPNPALGLDEQHDDEYYTVSVTSGRVLNYEMRLPNNESQQEATAFVTKSEFPSDATIVWQAKQDQCYQMEVKSPTLASVLSDPGIGDSDGEVFIEFQTDSSSTQNLNSYYDASNVNLATLGLGSYATASDAPGC